MDSLEGPSIAATVELQVRIGASAAEIAESMGVAWRHVEQSLTPIIGALGVAALYNRSLLLTGRTHPWLAELQEGASHPIDLSALQATLEQQESSQAGLAAGELLGTFYELLNGLIGPSLTRRLLRLM